MNRNENCGYLNLKYNCSKVAREILYSRLFTRYNRLRFVEDMNEIITVEMKLNEYVVIAVMDAIFSIAMQA